MSEANSSIPVYLFLGFLGVGKTSAITHLFKQKPDDEYWAVLVNEFGEQGIDGQFYEAEGIRVKELAGGCMCCAQGISLQLAVVELLRQQKPDRLLIESSGLGHAEGVLEILQSGSLKSLLDIRIISLVDPQHLLDKRYVQHENYINQIRLADIVVLNKQDRVTEASNQAWFEFSQRNGLSPRKLIQTTGGKLSLSLLLEPISRLMKITSTQYTTEDDTAFINRNWVYESDTVFDFVCLKSRLSDVSYVRLKGVVQTSSGWYLINDVEDEACWENIDKHERSTIEMILHADNAEIEDNFLADCVL